MKPHPRIRKTIKWGGAVVTVLLVVVWIGSGWMHVIWMGESRGLVSLGNGQVRLGEFVGTPFEMPGIRFYRSPWTGIDLDFRGDTVSHSASWHATIPLWVLALPVTFAVMIAWRLDTLARRRAKLNLCPKCNYDRTGLASKDAVCPECGAAASNSPPSSSV